MKPVLTFSSRHRHNTTQCPRPEAIIVSSKRARSVTNEKPFNELAKSSGELVIQCGTRPMVVGWDEIRGCVKGVLVVRPRAAPLSRGVCGPSRASGQTAASLHQQLSKSASALSTTTTAFNTLGNPVFFERKQMNLEVDAHDSVGSRRSRFEDESTLQFYCNVLPTSS